MFTLAHLSDPHLGPIPTPRLRELINKRGLGMINWYRKRHRHHHADVLGAIVADMKAQAPDHIAVTGDLVNVSLDVEFAAAARWLDTLGTTKDVTLVPGNHDAYIRRASGWAAQHWGEFMRGDDGAAFPFRAAARTGGADRADHVAADRAVHGDRHARRRADREACGNFARAVARAGVPRDPDPSPADPEQAPLHEAADRRADVPRDRSRSTARSWCCTGTITNSN